MKTMTNGKKRRKKETSLLKSKTKTTESSYKMHVKEKWKDLTVTTTRSLDTEWCWRKSLEALSQKECPHIVKPSFRFWFFLEKKRKKSVMPEYLWFWIETVIWLPKIEVTISNVRVCDWGLLLQIWARSLRCNCQVKEGTLFFWVRGWLSQTRKSRTRVSKPGKQVWKLGCSLWYCLDVVVNNQISSFLVSENYLMHVKKLNAMSPNSHGLWTSHFLTHSDELIVTAYLLQ